MAEFRGTTSNDTLTGGADSLSGAGGRGCGLT